MSVSISGGISIGGGVLPQTFRNLPVPMPGLALYTLAMFSPDDPGEPVMTYTFPLSPQALRKEFAAMSTVYETQGSAANAGVQRVVDMYGNSPFTFVIQGTTGQQRHSTDGFQFTGLESVQQILDLLNVFAQSNQEQMAQNNPALYTLEFYDYFTSTFWQVVPVGPQGISQSAQQPTLQFYQFRLAGIQPVNDPLPPDAFTDEVDVLFEVPAPTLMLSLQVQLSFAVSIY